MMEKVEEALIFDGGIAKAHQSGTCDE